MQEVINNIDIDKLPDDVIDAIIGEFAHLPLKSKIIVYSKLIHGDMFKITSNDFFNINKNAPKVVYRTFISQVKSNVRRTQ
tara:strand:- start:772 stop:1014 length:243 start_codon:yes stop_codon:yes gene_type:complete